MKFNHYLNKLHESSQFKKFSEKNKKAYLCAGFFVIDMETGKHIHQIDYALPNKKVATFLLDEGVKIKISKQTLKKKLPEIKTDIKTDIDALKGIVEDEMKNRTVTENIKKIIAILHIYDNKIIWNLQCILDGLTLLQVHVDDVDQSVLKFDKHSLIDLIKKQPGLAGGMQQPQQSAQTIQQPQIQEQQQQVQEQPPSISLNKGKELLEKLQEELKKEKAAAKKSEKKKAKGKK
ncbi:MAG: hypothetical protein ABIG37_02220 [Nanoarchaeota archaeon]|nr:hypothetical protein [Nanoarchaeota archaeon]